MFVENNKIPSIFQLEDLQYEEHFQPYRFPIIDQETNQSVDGYNITQLIIGIEFIKISLILVF